MAINFKDWQKTLHEETELQEGLHRVGVWTTEPNHKSYDKRENRRQKLMRVTASSQKEAEQKARAHFEKQGNYKVHETQYMGSIKEEAEQVEEALKGDQHKLDVDKDGKLEKSDFKKLRKGKEEIVVNKGENVKQEDLQIDETPVEKPRDIRVPSGQQSNAPGMRTQAERDRLKKMAKDINKKSFREFVEELEEAKKDDYWDFKDLKDEPKSTTRKIAGKAYGGAAQKDDDDEDDNNDKPAVKRGRGRPAGSKSGARTAGNGKQYGGLTIHSLNLPSKK